jgi:cytochrome c oxidase cbb3-type subunit 3
MSLFAMCLFLVSVVAIHAGQRGGQRGAAGPAGAQRGGGGGPAPTNFPAQQRPAGDPAVVARGNSLYGQHCRSCHGADLRGTDIGVNLLRSETVLRDKAGESILAVVKNGRQNRGMPPMPAMSLPDDDVRAIAEYLHSILATAQRQGGPPPGPPVQLNVLVGDAAAGKAYFESKCVSCHSATGDLAGIGRRQTNPTQLQNSWISGGSLGSRPVTVVVTLPGGQKVSGRLNRVDDFSVTVDVEGGGTRYIRRDGDTPKVEINDPREAHRSLLPQYTDKNIHDVTAYLVTLK